MTLRRAGRNGSRARVDERLTLGRGAHLVVVQVAGRRLLVGVTDHNVQLVTDLGDDEPAGEPKADSATKEPAAAARPQRFAEWLGISLRGIR